MVGPFIKMLAPIALLTVSLGASMAASAKELAIPQVQVWTTNTIRYSCAHGRALTVRYTNTKNEQSFALLNVNGRNMLFVNVNAASGAKYVAGQYVWWTKGPEGSLTDAMSDANAKPILDECKARR